MARSLTRIDNSLLQATAVIRWLTWAWAAFGLAISQEHLRHSAAAWLLMALAFAVTAGFTVLLTTAPQKLTQASALVVEFMVGVALLIGDGYVYEGTRPQSLPWAWPATALIAIGVAVGRRWAVIAAAVLAIASFIGEGLNEPGLEEWGVSASSRAGLYVLTALISGYVAHHLRQAEVEISAARAREEVSTQLHDGVLQTLAVIQRRSDDPELVALAHDQDRDLRDFLAGSRSSQTGLLMSLRSAASLSERRYGTRTEVVIADDLVEPSPNAVGAIAGAVGEALTNAAKHAQAERVVVYAEPTEIDKSTAGVFVSVKDNGVGFDPAQVSEGMGMRNSLRSRIESVGGRVEISSRVGRGTEVRIWVP